MTELQLGRLSDRCQFESMLRRAPVLVSAHFALYHQGWNPRSALADDVAERELLSTAASQLRPVSVDNPQVRLGIVVPKRLSKRAVTRSLLKRQVRAAAALHLNRLGPGIWIVRQRTTFQPAAEGSAASLALKHQVRSELHELLERVRCNQPSAKRDE